ncbi:MAG: M28 family peptidase [Anaeromyxobacter sp.]|nr:M28 family peptidase [Anaeromyxobacter sp.]MBL0278089.1 M28 family peptidase [Anaeromyxobacter sp.]
MHALPAALLAAVLSATPAAPAARPRPLVQEAPLRAHLAFLADDLLEGRGTGQRGGALAVRYLETQLRALGLAPAVGQGYLQRAEVQGVKLRPAESALTFHGPGGALPATLGEDLVAASGQGSGEVRLEAEVVFVGFGIQAAAERWDDYQGADLRGKLLLMLVNEPPPTAGEPGRFGGADLTEYGRWTWKFEEAARRGAAGVLLVHTTESASYGWGVVRTGFGGEKFRLAAGPRLTPLQGWVTEAFARRLAAAGGQDLDALRARALVRGFRPVPLGLGLTARLTSDVRTFTQENVAGVVRGTDPALAREAVLYSAHWDHFGVVDGTIRNGAVDNASGCAAALALAQAAAGSPARRSQVFLFTFGEEQGLLGASAWVQEGPWPVADTVANLNLESLNFVGPSRDVEFLGGRRSTLLALAQRVAPLTGLTLRLDDPDPAGLSFRSDHFPFARAGVPALSPGFSLAGQRDYLRDGEASRARAAANLERYHQASDDYDPAWDLSGMVQHAQFVLDLGQAVADAPDRPTWRTP